MLLRRSNRSASEAHVARVLDRRGRGTEVDDVDAAGGFRVGELLEPAIEERARRGRVASPDVGRSDGHVLERDMRLFNATVRRTLFANASFGTWPAASSGRGPPWSR